MTEFALDAKDSLVIVLIFLIAVAQALTILLTIRRERDVNELRELVDEQRLRLVELRAWLSGRNAAQPRLPKPERDTVSEPIANDAKLSEPPNEAIQSRTGEEEAAQAIKVVKWQREIIAGLRAGLKRDRLPEPGIAKAPEPAITPKDLPDAIRPGSPEDELERTTKAINSLKEEAEKARENVTSLHGTRRLAGGVSLDRNLADPANAVVGEIRPLKVANDPPAKDHSG